MGKIIVLGTEVIDHKTITEKATPLNRLDNFLGTYFLSKLELGRTGPEEYKVFGGLVLSTIYKSRPLTN